MHSSKRASNERGADREAERARSILRDTERAKRKIKRAYRIDCPQCDGTGKIHMDDQKRILRQIDEKLNVDQVSSSTHTRLLTKYLTTFLIGTFIIGMVLTPMVGCVGPVQIKAFKDTGIDPDRYRVGKERRKMKREIYWKEKTRKVKGEHTRTACRRSGSLGRVLTPTLGAVCLSAAGS